MPRRKSEGWGRKRRFLADVVEFVASICCLIHSLLCRRKLAQLQLGYHQLFQEYDAHIKANLESEKRSKVGDLVHVVVEHLSTVEGLCVGTVFCLR